MSDSESSWEDFGREGPEDEDTIDEDTLDGNTLDDETTTSDDDSNIVLVSRPTSAGNVRNSPPRGGDNGSHQPQNTPSVPPAIGGPSHFYGEGVDPEIAELWWKTGVSWEDLPNIPADEGLEYLGIGGVSATCGAANNDETLVLHPKQPAAGGRAQQTTCWVGLPTRTVIDHNEYPHLVRRIFHQMDLDSRLALRSSSKHWRDYVDAFLSEHLVIFKLSVGAGAVALSTTARRPVWWTGFVE